MGKRGVSYSELADRLGERGFKTNRRMVTNKISMGAFGADFLLACMDALGCASETSSADALSCTHPPETCDP